MFSNYYDFIFSLMVCFGVIMLKYINNYLICLNCIILFKNVFFFELPPSILNSQGKVELIKHTSICHALGFSKFIRTDYIIQWISSGFCVNYRINTRISEN